MSQTPPLTRDQRLFEVMRQVFPELPMSAVALTLELEYGKDPLLTVRMAAPAFRDVDGSIHTVFPAPTPEPVEESEVCSVRPSAFVPEEMTLTDPDGLSQCQVTIVHTEPEHPEIPPAPPICTMTVVEPSKQVVVSLREEVTNPRQLSIEVCPDGDVLLVVKPTTTGVDHIDTAQGQMLPPQMSFRFTNDSLKSYRAAHQLYEAMLEDVDVAPDQEPQRTPPDVENGLWETYEPAPGLRYSPGTWRRHEADEVANVPRWFECGDGWVHGGISNDGDFVYWRPRPMSAVVAQPAHWLSPKALLEKLNRRIDGHGVDRLTGFAGCFETESLLDLYLKLNAVKGWAMQLPDTREVKTLLAHFHTHGGCGVDKFFTQDRRLTEYAINELHRFADTPIRNVAYMDEPAPMVETRDTPPRVPGAMGDIRCVGCRHEFKINPEEVYDSEGPRGQWKTAMVCPVCDRPNMVS